jgi:hypothetical protein
MANTKINQVEGLGYDVTISTESYEGKDSNDDAITSKNIYYVKGFGIGMLVREDNNDAWDNLLNPEAHASRVLQFEHPDTDPSELLLADLNAAVSLGAMSQADADTVYDKSVAGPQETEATLQFQAAIAAVTSANDFEEAKANLAALLV